MSKKNTTALYLALPLLIAVPVLRADPIRAPTDWNIDDGSLRSVSVVTLTGVSATTSLPPADNANVIAIYAHRWNRDHDWDSRDPSPVPEPGILAPLLVLAASLLFLRKRLVAHS